LPAARSVLIFSLTTFLLDPDLRGILYSWVDDSNRILHTNKFLASEISVFLALSADLKNQYE
jgi:hypothetical protein